MAKARRLQHLPFPADVGGQAFDLDRQGIYYRLGNPLKKGATC